MKTRAYILLASLPLYAAAAAAVDGGAHSGECHALAKSRLGLYVHSDMYPLSDKEKSDALNALYVECMKPYNTERYGAQMASEAADKNAPASLTPAAAPIPLESKAYPPAPPPETGPHTAIAAPVSPVSMGPASEHLPPPAVTPAGAQTAAASPLQGPFKVAMPPPPEVAARIRAAEHPAPLPATREPPLHVKHTPKPPPEYDTNSDPTGKRQLEAIINQK